MDRWDYYESSYGSWQITQLVSSYNSTTNKTVIVEKPINTKKCSDEEKNIFYLNMSPSYKSMAA